MSSRSAVKAQPLAYAPSDILVTRLQCIGDVIFTLPAMHALRENFPTAKITYLTSKENRPLIEGFGDAVQDVITVDRSAYHHGNLGTIARETFSLLRTLRRKKFSLAIDFQGYGETALLTWLTGAPERWACVHRPARRFAFTRSIRRERSVHPAQRNVSLLEQCGLPVKSVRNEFILPAPAQHEARVLFARLKLDPAKPLLFIQPFSTSSLKNWPLEDYLALANHWRNQGMDVLFGGGPEEGPALEPARREGFAVSAGAPILVSAGLMKLCTVIVGGDTGLVHLAVAMGKRVVFLAASFRTHPFQHPDWKIAPPGGLNNMSGITVPTVIEACRRAFAENLVAI